MKKIIVPILLLLVVLLPCCMQPTEAVVQTTVVTKLQTQTVTVVKVVDPISGNEYVIQQGEVGVANADASVNSYFNGLDAHWIGLVLNGDDTEHQFNITVTPYNNPDKGILNSPANVADWVTITNQNLTSGVLAVAPMTAASLYTTLNVPSGIQLPQEWGFTVNVSRADQGNYVTVDAIRWLVHMRQP